MMREKERERDNSHSLHSVKCSRSVFCLRQACNNEKQIIIHQKLNVQDTSVGCLYCLIGTHPRHRDMRARLKAVSTRTEQADCTGRLGLCLPVQRVPCRPIYTRYSFWPITYRSPSCSLYVLLAEMMLSFQKHAGHGPQLFITRGSRPSGPLTSRVHARFFTKTQFFSTKKTFF